MKIRFLTLTPQQFAEVGATSNLLSQSEKFAILMNICSPSAAVPMPDGFSTSTVPRRKKSIADSYCSVSDFIKIFKFPPKLAFSIYVTPERLEFDRYSNCSSAIF